MTKLLFLILLPLIAYAQPQVSAQVGVSAVVPEQIIFQQNKNEVTVSTNYHGGFLVMSDKQIIKATEPSEKTFNLQPPFAVVVNF